MTRIIERLKIEDYIPPPCDICECVTEAVHVLDEDEGRMLALTNAGFCVACDTLIVRGQGTVIRTETDLLARGGQDGD